MDLLAMFRSEVPDPFLKDVVHSIISAYEEAHRHCMAKFPQTDLSGRLTGAAKDLLPIERRAYVERNLKEAAARYPGLRASTELNSIGNYSYTCVKSGMVVMTASAVRSPEQMVRDAEFRRTRARSNQEYLAFMEVPEPGDSDPLYAVVLHGPDELDSSRPAFIRVAFPDQELSTYLDHLNLMEKFGDHSGVPVIADVESIDDDLGLRIRKSAERKKREA